MFSCWHQYQSLTVDVSSVVGAPWRCGVLKTKGGIAGIGLGRLLGGGHVSTLQSGVEAPRLLKRSLFRLYCCCCCEGGVDVVGVVTPLVRGGAQVLHGDQVVELSVQLEVQEREEQGQDGEGQIEVEEERGVLKEKRTCTWMT